MTAGLPTHPLVLSLVKNSMTGKKSVATVWTDGHGPRIEGPSYLDSESGQRWFDDVVYPVLDFVSAKAKNLGIRLRPDFGFSMIETPDGQTHFCVHMTQSFSLRPRPVHDVLEQLAASVGRPWVFVETGENSTMLQKKAFHESGWQALRAHVDRIHLAATLAPASSVHTVRRL